MPTCVCVEKITLRPQGDKAEVDRVYKYLRNGMKVQAYMMNLCISALYTAKMNNASKEEIKELNHLYSRVPDSKKGSAYKFDMSEYPTGLTLAGSIPRVCSQKLDKAMKDGLKYGKVSLSTFKSTMPLMVANVFLSVRGSKTRSSGQIYDNGFYHDYETPMQFVDALEKDSNPKVHIRFVNGIVFDLVFGNPYQSRRMRLNIERIFSGEYRVCDSSIGINNKGKIILYLTYEKEIEHNNTLDENTVVGVDLGLAIPAVCALNTNLYKRCSIGSYDEFTRQRTKMKAQRTRIQKSIKYSSCNGHGRKKKIEPLDKVKIHERNWVNNYNHMVSKRIVDFALSNSAKYINIEDLSGIAQEEKDKFILSNWSYYELQQMIQNKAQAAGITVRFVEPAYTSQTCSVCGKMGLRKTQSEFICSDPDCKSHTIYADKGGFNADFNGARNIAMSENFVDKDKKKSKQKTA